MTITDLHRPPAVAEPGEADPLPLARQLLDQLIDAWDTWDQHPKDPNTADGFHTAVNAWCRHHHLDIVTTRAAMSAGRRGTPFVTAERIEGRAVADHHRTWLLDQTDRSVVLAQILEARP